MNDTVIKRFDTIEQFADDSSVCSGDGIATAHVTQPSDWNSWTDKAVSGEVSSTESTGCSGIRSGVITYTVLADKALSNLQRYRDQADSMNKTTLIKKYQNKISEFNQTKLKNYDNDIMTTRRQVQISVNEFKRRENNIFILKTFFVYLLICMIPLLLSSSMGNKLIPRNISLIILIVITLFFSIIFMRNLTNAISRSLINYDMINYDAAQEAGKQSKNFDGDLTIPTIQLLLLQNKSLLKDKQAKDRCGKTEAEITAEAIADSKEMHNWLSHIGEEIDNDNEEDYKELMAAAAKIEEKGSEWSRKGYPEVKIVFDDFAEKVQDKAEALNK